MRINLEYIQNLSDEELYKLNRQQIIRRLKYANNLAIDRRFQALEYLKQHPETPTPLVYKNYTKTVRPKHGAIDWKNYEFDFENGESTEELRKKLIMTRHFLSTKTSSIDGWLSSIKDFSIKMSKKLNIDVDLDSLSDLKYNRLWEVYNKLGEKSFTGLKGYDQARDSNQRIALIYAVMKDTASGYLTGKYSRKDDTRLMGIDRLAEYIQDIVIPRLEREQEIRERQEYDIDIIEDIQGGLGRQGY